MPDSYNQLQYNGATALELQKAYQLLGVETGDTEKSIRVKYHKAIRHYHPDSAGADSENALVMTQMLNAAFSMVVKDIHQNGGRAGLNPYRAGTRHRNPDESGPVGRNPSGRNSSHWGSFGSGADQRHFREDDYPDLPVSINPAAFCERTVYREGSLFADEGWFYEDELNDPDSFFEDSYLRRPRSVTSGMYYWDPDYENFPMFLYSLHQKCKALLQSEIVPPMMLHYLALEFIRPWDCLRKIADDYPSIRVKRKEGERPVYCFEARVQTDSRKAGVVHQAGTNGRTVPCPDADKEGVQQTSMDDGTGQQSDQDPEKSDIAGRGLSLSIINERVHLFLPSGEDAGHLSFEEDPLYYICLMILRQGYEDYEVLMKDDRSGSKQYSRNPGRGRNTLRLQISLKEPDGLTNEQSENHNIELVDLLRTASKGMSGQEGMA